MVDRPTGTVTLLFTDIEGSTRLLLALGERYPEVLATHRMLLRAAFRAHEGQEVDTQGDAFLVAFSSAQQAVLAAAAAQHALASYPWPAATLASAPGGLGEIRVRMGIHTGEPMRTAEGYVGLDVHRGARICSAGHGGQVLLSAATVGLVRRTLPDGIALRDLGDHHLKDLIQPEHLTQLELAGLPVDFPPLRSLDTHPNNLPTPSTPLTGREREVETIVGLLRRSETRLLTLSGPGGIGKTRLAIRVASELLHEFSDGVFFVDLAPLREGDQLLPALAQTLGVQETAGRTLDEGVLQILRARSVLLLLDNFEHLLPAADFLAQLLAASPKLTVLVTSRAALRLSGEHEFIVPPLALPASGCEIPFEALPDYAAIALFIERALTVRPDFHLTAENGAAVEAICHRLDGLPLAIELAAARILVLPPEALLGRLDHRLKLLTHGARDLPERQRTLRATIAWSYDLLDAAEQTLFRRLAVFAGSATLAAIEAICDTGDDLVGDVVDHVGALLEKSLLQRRDAPDGEPRFLMLATIREFALEALAESGEAEVIQQRYAAFFLALAESTDVNLLTGAWKQSFQLLDLDRDNLQAVFGAALARGDEEAALRLVGALRFWYPRRAVRDGRVQAEQALALPPSTHDPRLRARALDTVGLLAWYQSDYRAARSAWKQSSETWRVLDAAKELSWTVIALSSVYPDGARAIAPLLEEGLCLARRAGDPWTLANALYWAGYRSIGLEDLRAARAALEEAASLLRSLGEPMLLASVLFDLGRALNREGQDAMARDAFEEALSLARTADEITGITRSLAGLRGIALRAGDEAGAVRYCLEGLQLSQTIDWRRGIFSNLAVLAVIATRGSEPERIVWTFGALDRLRLQVAATWDKEQERILAAARATLGAGVFDQIWIQAVEVPLEQVTAEIVAATSDAARSESL